MTKPISDTHLAEIEAGLEGVTPGPWLHYAGGRDNPKTTKHIARMDPDTVASMIARIRVDGVTIAELRGEIKGMMPLVDDVAKRDERIKELERAIETTKLCSSTHHIFAVLDAAINKGDKP